jgi:hypothetical protein
MWSRPLGAVQLEVSIDDLERIPVFRLDAFVREAARWRGATPVGSAAAAPCESVGLSMAVGDAGGTAERGLDSRGALDRALQLSQVGRRAAALACCQHALRFGPGSHPFTSAASACGCARASALAPIRRGGLVV